jgi:hypothetical protein
MRIAPRGDGVSALIIGEQDQNIRRGRGCTEHREKQGGRRT